tara:strand:+ start:78 stop:584 length:507 start_codon:yes stop_codon:yes gene_type:complete
MINTNEYEMKKSELDYLKSMYPVFEHNKDLAEILRGEISAVEAYRQLEARLDSDPEIYRLRKFKMDHEKTVDFWKKEARINGEIPPSSSSIWGIVVKAFVGVSKIIGEEVALNALKKGEEHGLSTYNSMLESKTLTKFHKDTIRQKFIPMQMQHIESINALLELKKDS